MFLEARFLGYVMCIKVVRAKSCVKTNLKTLLINFIMMAPDEI
jgi:hypothetical protein